MGKPIEAYMVSKWLISLCDGWDDRAAFCIDTLQGIANGNFTAKELRSDIIKVHAEKLNVKRTTIDELISRLQSLPNKHRLVTIVVGDDDTDGIDTELFDIYHTHELEHPIELFVHEDLN
ncbi:hypothetical protein LCGC14_1426000 [marine sediment metagenome]|uniref:Uncharacterized protein n=1 Tax=marine sediment metagenome TaxID=412755 RepID=A0A0F9KB24_9ZZZZ